MICKPCGEGRNGRNESVEEVDQYRVGWDRRLFINCRELAKKKAWELMIKGKGKC